MGSKPIPEEYSSRHKRNVQQAYGREYPTRVCFGPRHLKIASRVAPLCQYKPGLVSGPTNHKCPQKYISGRIMREYHSYGESSDSKVYSVLRHRWVCCQHDACSNEKEGDLLAVKERHVAKVCREGDKEDSSDYRRCSSRVTQGDTVDEYRT